MDISTSSLPEVPSTDFPRLAIGEVDVSLIIPTLNEAANLPYLLLRIDAAMAGRRYEIRVIDDGSTDGTPAVCAELSKQFPVVCHVRESPSAGLGGAVLEGIKQSRGRLLVVMDADLQHPPEKLPELLTPLERGESDFVIGSRYVAGGSTEDRWGLLRKLYSRTATLLARPFSGAARDPMSGFFALRRDTLDRARRLTPLGYKIGLELMCKCRVRDVREVPIHFGLREHGQSKLTLTQQFKYLEHLSRLYDFHFPRASPAAKFMVATTIGWLFGLAFYLLLILADFSPASAPPLAYVAGVAATAVFHLRYVRTQRDFIPSKHPWRDFWMTAACEFFAAAVAAKWAAVRVRDATAIELFTLAFAAGTIARYVLRKELLQDLRGLRRDPRAEEIRPREEASESADPIPLHPLSLRERAG